jgi:hypothetical protein
MTIFRMGLQTETISAKGPTTETIVLLHEKSQNKFRFFLAKFPLLMTLVKTTEK